jgi:hypothetical protein
MTDLNKLAQSVRLAGIGLALSFCVSACQTNPFSDMVIGPSYQPVNVFQLAPRLPAELRRVALLPLAADAQMPMADAGRESLDAVLSGELSKTKKFELVPVTPDQLREWTGHSQWTAPQKLPADFFKVLAEHTGADAILFPELTVFRAYPPLAVGWRLKLVECTEQRVWWAIDEVFDAGESKVSNGARRFQQAEQRSPGALLDSTGILGSPRRFGQYAAATAVGTLPDR